MKEPAPDEQRYRIAVRNPKTGDLEWVEVSAAQALRYANGLSWRDENSSMAGAERHWRRVWSAKN